MKTPTFVDHPDLHLDPMLHAAVACTLEVCSSAFRHLPVPVRFRAAGALQAWLQLLNADADAGAGQARAALSDPSLCLSEARRALTALVQPRIRVRQGMEGRFIPVLEKTLRFSTNLLCFWMRQGALYEPSLPLGTLLGGTDIAHDMPLQLLAPPNPALCIVPHWQQRHHCANFHALLVYEHAALAVQAPAKRALTVLACRPCADGVDTSELVLPVKEENDTLLVALERAIAGTMPFADTSGFASGQDVQQSETRWKPVLDYVSKVLLYLRLDTAFVRALTPYTAAPKEFPGLGRRRREAKLAEVDQLYDRYIVGPQSLAEIGVDEHGAHLLKGHQLPAHWRRGHFRLQPYGPQASLRKVIFIAPTVVRADKLTDSVA